MPAFPLSARLSTPAHYGQVFGAPEVRVSCRAFLVLARAAETDCSRLGVVVAKKHVRLAHRRNRLKRLIREQFRCNPPDLPLDMVVLARHNADHLSNEEVFAALNRLWMLAHQRVVAA